MTAIPSPTVILNKLLRKKFKACVGKEIKDVMTVGLESQKK